MKLIFHDLDSAEFESIIPAPPPNVRIISDEHPIHHCLGCFSCWVKTPATCIIRDAYGDMGASLARCSELIIISNCCYGGFSPFIKNLLDRSISYVHPDLVIRNGEMHHKRRYDNQIKLKVLFYGENLTTKEKQTANQLVEAFSLNLDSQIVGVSFFNTIPELRGKAL